MVDEPGLIAVEAGIHAKWEKAVLKSLIHFFLVRLFVVIGVVHIEQIAAPDFVIVGPTNVAVLISDHFSSILSDEGSSWNFLFGIQSPHAFGKSLSGSIFSQSWCDIYLSLFDNHFPPVRIVLLDQAVQAVVFVAAARWGALVKIEVWVKVVGGSVLEVDKGWVATLEIMGDFWISGLNQLIVILVARASLWVNTPISAWAFALLSPPLHIVEDPLVFYNVFLRIAPFSAEKWGVIRRIIVSNCVLPKEVENLYWVLIFFEFVKSEHFFTTLIKGCVQELFKLPLLLVIEIMVNNIDTKVFLLILVINLYTFLQDLLDLHLYHLSI